MEFCRYRIPPEFFTFFLNVFDGPASLLSIFSSATPQRTAYIELTIPDGSPSKDSQFTQAGEIARFVPGTAGLQFGDAACEPPRLH
jgi:hypothetical protein